MRHLLTIITVSVIGFIIFMTVDWEGIDLSLSVPSVANTAVDKQPKQLTHSEDELDWEEYTVLGYDTLMYAKGHAFGCGGDLLTCGGWYFDTVCVGDDQILSYDSVGPATMKLSLVSRELFVDLGDPDALIKIRDFMMPIDGFSRFQKSYEQCIDSIIDEKYGVIKNMGEFYFTIDYADSCNGNADKINRFVCQLLNVSENEKSQVSALSAFYAGYNTTKYYRPVYTGDSGDVCALSDFVANKTFENWIRGGNFDMGSSQAVLAIKPHVANERYVTFSKYEYDREGLGHGMYTETFHTFDMKNGNKMTNSNIFKSKYLDKVKMRLFEVMAKDPHYLEWHGGTVSPTEIEEMIESWQSLDDILEGTEWEVPKRDVKFKLPDGALTASGVVFSFQPYEIDCWAAGTYHFTVPYKKLVPYLTPKAKELIKNIN